MPATKSLRSGTCASTLLPAMRSACLPSRDELRGEPRAEEVHPGRDALVDRDLGDVGCRLDAEHGHAERQKVLQQIAVVAGELDDQAVGAKPEARRDHLAVGLARGRPMTSNRTRSTRIR